jgi:hypothetical protein
MGTNAAAVLADTLAGAEVDDPADALALLAALAVVPCVVLVPADELEPLQPASTPIPRADAAVSASFAPVIPRLPPRTGRPRRDRPISSSPLAPGQNVP